MFKAGFRSIDALLVIKCVEKIAPVALRSQSIPRLPKTKSAGFSRKMEGPLGVGRCFSTLDKLRIL